MHILSLYSLAAVYARVQIVYVWSHYHILLAENPDCRTVDMELFLVTICHLKRKVSERNKQ